MHEKGSCDDCDNFRDIAILSLPGKVFCRVLLNRMKENVNRLLRENQCGFQKGQGFADQLFSLHMLMEHAHKFHQLFLYCVDLKKAYDSVKIVKHYGLL